MTKPRPPEHLLHGLDGPVVVLTARVCAYLNRYAGLDEFRINHRGTDPEVDGALVAMRTAQLFWRKTATGTADAPHPEPGRTSWYTTAQAAVQLRITSRAVRKAIADGRLAATSVDGRWRIDREALALFNRRDRND